MSPAHDDATAARSPRVLRVARRPRLSPIEVGHRVAAYDPPSDEWWELVDPADDEDQPPLARVLVRAAAPGVRDLHLVEVLADDPVTALAELLHQTVARLRRSDTSLVTVSAPASDLRALLLEVDFVAFAATGEAERFILEL